jgi:hypothetical protein
MKKKQLSVVCHIKNSSKRIIPVEHLKDASNVIVDFQAGVLEPMS